MRGSPGPCSVRAGDDKWLRCRIPQSTPPGGGHGLARPPKREKSAATIGAKLRQSAAADTGTLFHPPEESNSRPLLRSTLEPVTTRRNASIPRSRCKRRITLPVPSRSRHRNSTGMHWPRCRCSTRCKAGKHFLSRSSLGKITFLLLCHPPESNDTNTGNDSGCIIARVRSRKSASAGTSKCCSLGQGKANMHEAKSSLWFARRVSESDRDLRREKIGTRPR